jgi:hypothetical protein
MSALLCEILPANIITHNSRPSSQCRQMWLCIRRAWSLRRSYGTVYLSMVKDALVETLLINTRRNKIKSKYIIVFLSSYVLYSRIIPLSYAWGDAIITRPILLNGVETTVTVHLDSDLRNLDLTGSERLLWIDTLCITSATLRAKPADLAQARHLLKCTHFSSG